MSAKALIRGGAPQGAVPHDRFLLSAEAWARLPGALAEDPAIALLGLWAELGTVHAAFLDETTNEIFLASAVAEGGRYAALSPARPGAIRFERMIRDLWGLTAEGAVDLRPWLDHGRWQIAGPMSANPLSLVGAEPPQPEFLPVEGEGIHQIPVGPIHAGVIEPGHFRFHIQGEVVVRLEARLGYKHKGVLSLMLGKSPRAAAVFPARLSGDSTVAFGWAFAAAAEAALGVTIPPRAIALRAVMGELERIHNHLNDWGFVCNDAAFAFPHARCGFLREGVLRACAAAFGHRLMMDGVLPGGIAPDIAPGGAELILAALAAVEAEIPALRRIYDSHASLQDRVVGTGFLDPAHARRFAAGGFVGRGSGRGFDARLTPGYAPYDWLLPPIAVETGGDVDARVRVRVAELATSIGLVRRLLAELPPGETLVPLPSQAGEGVALIEGFRGECLAWVRLDEGGLIRGCFLRDPSWLQWPLLEAAIEGNIVADFPLCNKSFNCSYSGVDL
ncbi:hydrogenase expression protein HypE [Roseomonas sp. HJA6]|uniref:Hydrogenase expression protein HypE n=1 Tax=Roseomonas alba TaxID=2846776 RepID=A0ABS7A2H5_9PROT|nr:hydrogenase expression protein HypE [Neoroseomonas alba]MBW6396285.1 hydrogenase expression protein HypE [Neoroseomonas alba]